MPEAHLPVEEAPAPNALRTAALAACRERSREAALRFIRSVVVIDNDAYMGGVPQNAVNPLDVGEVTKAFAQQGINCAVYRPEQGEDIVGTCLQLLKQADAAIIDWHLGVGNDTGPCKEAIKALVMADVAHGAPVRLIIIYTAEEPAGVRDDLARYLTDLGLSSLPEGAGFGLQNARGRILVLKKTGENEVGGPAGLMPEERHYSAKPSELPRHVVDAFSDLVDGLVPSVALHAISAIRERSHDLLGAFNKGLDSSFLLHTALIPNKQDAHSFIVGLVSEENGKLVSGDGKIKSLVSPDSLKQYIAKTIESSTYRCATCSGTGRVRTACTLCRGNDRACVVCRGSGRYHKVCERCKGKKSWAISERSVLSVFESSAEVKNLPEIEKLLEIFCTPARDGGDGGYAFCRMSMLSAESETGTRPYTGKEVPVLHQGTMMVRTGEDGRPEVFVCIVPQCDAVRIRNEERLFPCIKGEMTSGINKASYVVRYGGEDKFVSIPKQISWKCMEAIAFNGEDSVLAVMNEADKFFYFTDVQGKRYRWLADLRQSHALKLASEAVPSLGRVGIDEFEWHRRIKEKIGQE
ncbi:response regulator receiver domain [Nitratidesulfovibrio sp.]|uniref:response regulator receiver domain n=1 Tax=Nitratidesulfovibrio sp. TaxID=2802297 RepID=UPI0033425EE9